MVSKQYEVKVSQHTTKNVNYEEFDSLGELVKTLDGAINNYVFSDKSESMDKGSIWAGTESMEVALDLLKHGDTLNIDKITAAIKADKVYKQEVKVSKNEYNVHGYQASVPRYLQGLPTSMINQKKVAVKQKVLNLYKNVTFGASVSVSTIISESKKAVQLIQLLESKGYRVNLKVAFMTEIDDDVMVMVSQIKHSSEKLNISKLAFPLANPSMLRRICLRWMETTKLMTRHKFKKFYGYPMANTSEMKSVLPKEDVATAYMIPSFMTTPEEVIKDWNL